jgi:thymidylate kinase
MSRAITAIEGVCCAGKTTLLKRLAAQQHAAVVPETSEFARSIFQPFDNGKNILSNALASMPIERIRMQAAADLSKVTGHAILDRSFLSTLALGYGAIDLIGKTSFQHLSRAVIEEIRRDRLTVPNRVLYIRVDSTTVQKRNETRRPPLDPYWVASERIDRQNVFYQHLSEKAGLTAVDGTRSAESVLTECTAHLQVGSSGVTARGLAKALENFATNVV